MRILGLNGNSDSYYFVLVPEAVAKRWINVKIGDNQYVEDSDWQFLPMVKAVGLQPRSTEHPAGNEQAVVWQLIVKLCLQPFQRDSTAHYLRLSS